MSLGDFAPTNISCPITGCLMRDPVINCMGQTYDRAAILEYWRTGALRDPVTNCDVRNQQLFPNQAVRVLVQDFLDAHPDYTPSGWPNRNLVPVADPSGAPDLTPSAPPAPRTSSPPAPRGASPPPRASRPVPPASRAPAQPSSTRSSTPSASTQRPANLPSGPTSIDDERAARERSAELERKENEAMEFCKKCSMWTFGLALVLTAVIGGLYMYQNRRPRYGVNPSTCSNYDVEFICEEHHCQWSQHQECWDGEYEKQSLDMPPLPTTEVLV